MNIVIINGSHRPKGNCENFSKYLHTILEKKHQVNLINLIQKDIKPCNGCLMCEEGEECPIKDDFTLEIKPLLEHADLIVFATPSYFNMPSAQMVNFINRTNCMCDYFANNHKKCLFYLTGQTDTETIMEAYKCLHSFAEIMEMEEVADPIINVVRMPEEISDIIIHKVQKMVDNL